MCHVAVVWVTPSADHDGRLDILLLWRRGLRAREPRRRPSSMRRLLLQTPAYTSLQPVTLEHTTDTLQVTTE